ncbi:MAG: DUF3574 domain-containing protein [Phenylobacterium sp.]
MALALAGCASLQQSACPAGQEKLKTAQLFFGQQIDGKSTVSDADFHRFVEDELTPRFPDGLTVLNADGQWRASGNPLVRDASKVVLIVLPARGDASSRIEAVQGAYKRRFRQDSVLVLTQATCVSL